MVLTCATPVTRGIEIGIRRIHGIVPISHGYGQRITYQANWFIKGAGECHEIEATIHQTRYAPGASTKIFRKVNDVSNVV